MLAVVAVVVIWAIQDKGPSSGSQLLVGLGLVAAIGAVELVHYVLWGSRTEEIKHAIRGALLWGVQRIALGIGGLIALLFLLFSGGDRP